MYFKYRVLIGLVTVLFTANLLSAQSVSAAKFQLIEMKDGRKLIDDFESYLIGTLPNRWYNRDGDRIPANLPPDLRQNYQYYVAQEEGNKYLHYEGKIVKHLNFPLFNKHVNIFETPILQWKWRVWDLPEGGNEKVNSKNDAAANLYVVFGFHRLLFKKVPRTIRYTWSATLEPGTVTTKLFGNQVVYVLKSGRDNMGEWVEFERDIVDDYRRFFGEDPPAKPVAILILGEGDSTDDQSIVDFDDLMLAPI